MKWIFLAPLILLGVLLALVCIVLLLRVGVRLVYRDGQPGIWVKVSIFSIRVFPHKPRRKKKRRKENGQAAGRGAPPQQAKTHSPDAETQRPEPAKTTKETPRQDKAEKPGPSVETLCAYARFAMDAGGRVMRGLRVDKLWLRADIGTPDAAKTALAYGGASAAVANLWPLAESILDIRKKDIFLNACFEKETSTIEGEIVITALVGRMALIGLRILKQYSKLKKAVQTNEQSERLYGSEHGKNP